MADRNELVEKVRTEYRRLAEAIIDSWEIPVGDVPSRENELAGLLLDAWQSGAAPYAARAEAAEARANGLTNDLQATAEQLVRVEKALRLFMEACRDEKADKQAEMNAILHAYNEGRAALAVSPDRRERGKQG